MRALEARELRTLLASGARAVDVREPVAFAEAHLRGSLNIALSSRSAPYWLNVLTGSTERLIVVTATAHEATAADELLSAAERDGLGAFVFDAAAVEGAGVPLASFRTVTPDELAGDRERHTVVDVREPREYAAGHVPGALSLPLDELAGRIAEVPPGAIAAICGSGFRSSAAASLLEAAGRTEVVNVWGGTMAWMQMGLPLAAGKRP